MASVLRGSGDSSFGGNLSIEGVLTYEDVSSVDSVGVITARSDVIVGGGLSVTGISTFNGITTSTTSLFAKDFSVSGVSTFSGSRIDIGTGTSISSPSSNVLTLGTNNEERLRITSDGKVGIGTDDPTEKLHTLGTGDLKIKLETTSSGVNSNVGLFLTTATEGSWILQTGNAVSGGIRLYDLVSNAERLRIDSSGRLLVGTSSASTGSSAQYAILQAQGSTNSSTGGGIFSINLGNSGNTLVSDNYVGGLYYASTVGEFASIECRADGTCGSGDYPGRLVFSTTADGAPSPTERMRINNSGISFIYSDTDPLVIGSALSAGTSNRLINGVYNRTSTTGGGTTSFKVYTNGNVENTNDAYGQISDVKLKENIVDAPSQWDDFKAVRFRKYNFKEESGYETFTQLGVIAQELELTSPGLVYETADQDAEGNDLGTTTKAVKSSVLTKKALVALQEAMARIEQLEAKVTALEAS